MEEKIFFKPGDTVTLKQDIPNKPKMVVVCKASSYIRSKDNYFRGIKCRWFTTDMELQESVFNTKDLVIIESVSEN